jgi:UDP-3-O-[3-hydroxymyristoyl] glucosamine N-acyltransferase
VARGLYIAGTGSFAVEVAGWAADAGVVVEGLIAIQRPHEAGGVIHGLPVVGVDEPPAEAAAVLGLGGDRRMSWEALDSAGWLPAGIIHPTAHLAGSATVAASATIGPLAVLGAEASVGEQAILSRGVLVGHHTAIGNFATLNPGANVGGNATVGADAFLGIGCVVVNGIGVGAGATIAAGAVTIREVAADVRVQGVPALPYLDGGDG